mmetsp:Transcript_41005/g.128573  ORF Transcript_41005/g.128573 Transcript_41005/m.128573 type:complete len:166 (+) Transcript_41005:107-604(+)
MPPGRGVRHSEHNLNKEKPLRFIQTWITPRARGLPPNYGSMCGDDVAENRQNAWAHLLSDNQNTAANTPVEIAQDANMYATELEEGVSLQVPVGPGRQGYMLCIDGAIAVSHADADGNPVELVRHDAAEIMGDENLPLKITAGPDGAHVILFEMANNGAGGRTDF